MENLIAIDRVKHKTRLHVDWYIGKRCIYECSYCTPDIHDSTSNHFTLDQLKYAADKFASKIKGSDISIGFTGGEPTVNPNFKDFCQYLYENGVTNIFVTTNGSRTAEYYKELCQYVSALVISQHFEFSKVEDFLPKVKELSIFDIKVQLMFNANYFEQVKQSVSFYKNNVTFTLRRIRQKGKTTAHNYTDEQLNWYFENFPEDDILSPNTVVHYKEHYHKIKENNDIKTKKVHVNELTGAELTDFNGWHCWIGLRNLHIWLDGSIYRGNCHEGGIIGNLYAKDFELPTEPIVCGLNRRCFCAPEIKVKKVKELQYEYLLDEANV